MDTVSIFKKHIETLGEILLTFKVDAERASAMLDDEKNLLDAESRLDDEFIAPALYNALATIRTSPEQEQANLQLLDAIADARAELEIIMETMPN